MLKSLARLWKIREDAQALMEEKKLPPVAKAPWGERFVHFWVLVGRSFARNRCPIRASALAFATLLALIPMLAVVVSITSSLLKGQGQESIDQFIEKLVATVTPPAMVDEDTGESVTNAPTEASTPSPAAEVGALQAKGQEDKPTAGTAARHASAAGGKNSAALVSLAQDQRVVAARKEVAGYIHEFIQNTRSGTLGLTGSVLLIFAAISMLSRIEMTFNDIWGVVHGRSWFMRIVLYWGVLSLAPLLLVVVLGLASGPHLETTRRLLSSMPFVETLVFQVLPVVVLCLSFALFYALMPNIKVDWRAAAVGGFVGGILFHLNNEVSVLYVSRVVSNSRVYGSLGLVPVFMIGLYFSWLILLFGAQVAYAFQNRATYAEEKQVENINQRGREFVALRLMTSVGQRFVEGEPPPTVAEMAQQLAVPSRLVQQVMQTLATARLAVETSCGDPAYLPARPLETITCHDILLAMRATQGQEFATRDEPTRAEVLGEFQRIQEAEQQAASAVTMLGLVNRAQQKQLQAAPAAEKLKIES
jgi:membrane protein